MTNPASPASRDAASAPPPSTAVTAGSAEVWEPGAPSVQAMGPSAIFGAVIPLAIYYIVRHHVNGDAEALAIAGAFPALWIAVEWVRRRTVDVIGAIVLFGFVAGLLAAVALGGSAFVLKVRDSAFTSLFGVVCLVSLTWGRPAMFFLGKALSAGDDPARKAAFDEMWELPTVPAVFRVITAAWGVGLICEAALRVVLAMVMTTGAFLAVSPVIAAVTFGGLFAFTVRYTKRKREQSSGLFDELGLTFPSVPITKAA